jgi:hypothetical protein
MPSTSAKQHRFMAAIAHSPSFAKKVGVSQSVGKDFTAADKSKTFKQGGMMKKRHFDEGGETSAYEIDPDSRRAHGLYDKEPTPKAVAKVAPKTPAKPALKNYGNETDAGPKEDTSPVRNIRSFRKAPLPSKEQLDTNAERMAKIGEGVAMALPVGRVAKGVHDVGKAASAVRNAATKYAETPAIRATSKANEARYAAREASSRNRLGSKDIEDFKKGGMMKESKGMIRKEMAFMKNKGAPKSMIKHEKAEMMGMKKGGMPMKDGKPAFMNKFAKGGSIRRMADGGMTAPMAPPMAPQAPVDPRQMAAMQAAMQAQGGAPMAPPAPGMKRGGSVRFAKGGGIESRGKTKGTIIRMASGGSVSSASRRADGIAQRGKTRC